MRFRVVEASPSGVVLHDNVSKDEWLKPTTITLSIKNDVDPLVVGDFVELSVRRVD